MTPIIMNKREMVAIHFEKILVGLNWNHPKKYDERFPLDLDPFLFILNNMTYIEILFYENPDVLCCCADGFRLQRWC